MNSEESVNGWWIPSSPYNVKEYRQKQKQLSEINKSNTFKVLLCTSCSRAHEIVWEYGTGSQLYYYKDFPTIGLHRAKCRICIEDEN